MSKFQLDAGLIAEMPQKLRWADLGVASGTIKGSLDRLVGEEVVFLWPFRILAGSGSIRLLRSRRSCLGH